jgi:hypothetical protein
LAIEMLAEKDQTITAIDVITGSSAEQAGDGFSAEKAGDDDG